MAGPSQQQKIDLGSKDSSHTMYESFSTVCKTIALAIVVGLIAWLFATALKIIIEKSSEFLFEPFHYSSVSTLQKKATNKVPTTTNRNTTESKPAHSSELWVFLLIIMLGSITRSFLFRSNAWKTVEGDGATESINYFLSSYNKPSSEFVEERFSRSTFSAACRRLLVTALTLGCGGSGGLEGPIIPIGENIGAGICRWFGVKEANSLRALQMAGIAAAVCTLLNAPFASAIFATEVVYSERIVYRTFLYSIFSVVAAYALNQFLFTTPPLFSLTSHAQHYTLGEYFMVSLVAIFCSGPCGFGLKWFFGKLKKVFGFINPLYRAPLGALLAAILALSLWFAIGIQPGYVLGMSERTLADLLAHTGNPLLQIWWILLIVIIVKTLTTGFTLMTGGSAGLLVPAMILGGSMGACMFHLLSGLAWVADANAQIFIIAGIASSLVAVIEVPLASIALIIEMFGSNYAAPVMVAVGVCHIISRNMRMYAKQRV